MKIQKKNYKINSMRLKNWDYSSSGWYFITICTQNKIHYFSDISNLNLQKNTLGEIADKFWKEIPIHFPFIELGEYIIMPNHLHGLLYVNNQELNPIILHDKKNIPPKKFKNQEVY
jgi:REP element-mobilizing transposase RayT